MVNVCALKVHRKRKNRENQFHKSREQKKRQNGGRRRGRNEIQHKRKISSMQMTKAGMQKRHSHSKTFFLQLSFHVSPKRFYIPASWYSRRFHAAAFCVLQLGLLRGLLSILLSQGPRSIIRDLQEMFYRTQWQNERLRG